MTATESWVRVRDINELSPGVAVELRPCGACQETERLTVKGHPGLYVHGAGIEVIDGGCMAGKAKVPGIPDAWVREGRVWSLVLCEPASATERKKELVRG